MSDEAEFLHLLHKCREALDGDWGVLSTGEKIAAALVLNRADWLQGMGYTIPEAIERIGPTWTALLPLVAAKLREES